MDSLPNETSQLLQARWAELTQQIQGAAAVVESHRSNVPTTTDEQIAHVRARLTIAQAGLERYTVALQLAGDLEARLMPADLGAFLGCDPSELQPTDYFNVNGVEYPSDFSEVMEHRIQMHHEQLESLRSR